ncbi:hypothetical protein UFOVP999_58 [uncultured Caudovirales phage]|uniref:Uncharacterized protein n=1 Tax=uncultured Caudovirales phage TaxID=2100421 RepID=A0A6J5Q7U6_9CAUD|nr:hypothetical protein UFOVP999_58 [uncultured Caudovirales phage]
MSDLVLKNISDSLEVSSQYLNMVKRIEESLPAISRDTSNFYKADSQMKNVTLDITEITPMATLKHILAVIEKTKSALQESYIGLKKNKIEIKEKTKKLETAKDTEKELLEVEIEDLLYKSESAKNYTNAAIRKMNFMVTQYNTIMETMGKDKITEEEYELAESKHHISTALKQALCSARTRGGIIDEGNHIYLFDLGINGQVVQYEVLAYLQMEENLLKLGQEPTFDMTLKWINDLSEKFISNPAMYSNLRGLKMLDYSSLSLENNNA